MRKTIVALVALFPLSTFAVANSAPTLLGTRSVRITCTSGTCDAPTTGATDGMSLDGVGSVSIQVCAASGQTVNSGTVTTYFYDPLVGVWAKGATYTPAASSRCVEVGGDSPGRGIPILSSRGRMTVDLDLTLSSGAATVNMLATDLDGVAR